MNQPPRPARFSRGLKLLTVLTIGFIVVMAGLYQVFSRQSRPAAAVESAEIPGAADASGGAGKAPGARNRGGTAAAGGARRSGEAVAEAVATFPSGAGGAPVAPTEGFLRAGQPGVDYTAAYVVHRGTGHVLYAHNAHKPVPTASMAKMMTSLIAMEEIGAGRLALADSVTISARAAGMGGSQIYAAQGQVFSVRTLLAAIMVQSANDATTALAEKIAGSNEAFAELMNRRARALGLEGSTFHNPHGLPSPGSENMMTARDLAVVGNELMRYPLMREYAAARTVPFENATFTAGMTNPNFLLRQYEGAYGIKTGYSGPAGFSVTGGARRGDTDVIAVLTGAKSSRGPQSSFALVGRLMDEVFLSWSAAVPVQEGDTVGTVPVRGGAARAVRALAGRDVTALVPRGQEAAVQWELEPRTVHAPVARGDTVGTVVVVQGDKEVARVPALAANAVGARPWWRFWGG